MKTHGKNAEYHTSAFKTLVFMLPLLIAFSSCQKEQDDITGGGGNTNGGNDQAPGFTLKSLSGTDVKLSDYNNKIVVIFFFGYNCAPCLASSPSIESILYTPFQSRGDYQLLGLDTWNGNQSSVQAFQSSTGVSFPLLLNASAVASDYKTTYDKLVVINKEGKIVFRGYQAAAADIETVKQKVESLLAQ